MLFKNKLWNVQGKCPHILLRWKKTVFYELLVFEPSLSPLPCAWLAIEEDKTLWWKGLCNLTLIPQMVLEILVWLQIPNVSYYNNLLWDQLSHTVCVCLFCVRERLWAVLKVDYQITEWNFSIFILEFTCWFLGNFLN